MSTRKSDLINILSNNYPNFLKRDLKKLIQIFFNEMRNSLKRHERVELRDVFSIEPKLKKSRIILMTTQKMLWPILYTVLTTVCAFLSLIFTIDCLGLLEAS